MRIVKLFLGLIGILILVFVIILAYSGFFKSVDVKEEKVGTYAMIYLHHSGSYQYCYELQDSVERMLNRTDIPVKKSFVLYYDNPQDTKTENLESDAGCIVPEGEYDMSKLPSGFQYKVLKPGKAMIVEFPHRNDLSLYAGILKAYSQFRDHREKHGYREGYSLEMFDQEGDKIIFLMPVLK